MSYENSDLKNKEYVIKDMLHDNISLEGDTVVSMNMKNFINVVRKLLSYKKTFFILFFVMFLASLYYILSVPPKYKAEAILQKRKNPLYQIVAKNNFYALYGSSIGVEKDIEIIKSFGMMNKVVRRLNLNTTVTVKDSNHLGGSYAMGLGIEKFSVPNAFYGKKFMIRMTQGQYYLQYKAKKYPIRINKENTLVIAKGNVVKILFKPKFNNISKYVISQSSVTHAAKLLSKEVSVNNFSAYSDLIRISAITTNPNLSVDIINSLSDEAMSFSSRYNQGILRRMIDFLENRTSSLDYKIQNKVKSLMSQLSDDKTLSHNKQLDYYMTSLRKIQDQLIASKLELQSAKDRIMPTHPKYVTLQNKYTLLKKNEVGLIDKIKGIPEKSNKVSYLIQNIDLEKDLYYSLYYQMLQLKYIQKTNLSGLSFVVHAVKPEQPLSQYIVVKILFAIFMVLLLSCVIILVYQNISRLYFLLKNNLI